MDKKAIFEGLGNGTLSVDEIDKDFELSQTEIQAFLASSLPTVRKGVATLLSQLPSSSISVDWIDLLLLDRDSLVVAEALWTLEGRRHIAMPHVKRLIDLASNPDWKVRLPAVTVLADLSTKSHTLSINELLRLIDDLSLDQCEAVRSECSRLIESKSFPESTIESILRRFLEDSSSDVRCAALTAVKKRNPRFHVVTPAIDAALVDSSYDVQVAVCELIALYPGETVNFAERLRELAQASDDEVKQAALTALS